MEFQSDCPDIIGQSLDLMLTTSGLLGVYFLRFYWVTARGSICGLITTGC